MFNDHNIFSNNIHDAAQKLRQIQEAQLYSANQMIAKGRPIAASRLRRQDTRELSNIIDATRGLSTEDMKRMYDVTPEDIEAFTRVHADIVGKGPGKKLMPIPGSPAVRDAEQKAYEADVNFAKVFGGTHPEEGRAMAPHLRRTLAWLSTRPHRKDMTPNVFDDLNADGKVSAREVESAQQENQFTGKIEEQQNNFNKTLLNEAPRRGGRQAIMPGSMPSIMQQLQMPQMPAPVQAAPTQQYVAPQMAPNFVQPANNPAQPQDFNVATSGMGVGIAGTNVPGPAAPQYVAPQMAPNYVQPGNNPQQWSVVNAGKGTTPNQFAQMSGGIMKAIDDVRRGVQPQQPQPTQATGQKGNFAQLSGSPILQALSNVRQGKLPNEVSRPQDIKDYLGKAGQQSGTRMTQTTIPAGDPNNPATYMPGNVQVSNRPSPAEFNQAAMKPGGIYQIDQSGYAQSYLPAQQQNVAPTRVKQQPAQQQADNYQPVAGEYWKSPTQKVVPQQAQPQNYGAFGMRGQSPEEMEAYNRQVNSRKK